MALTFTPPFIQTAFGSPASISTAVTDRTGATAGTTVVTGGTNGSRVTGIRFTATGITSEGYMLIFHLSGATRRFIGEIPIAAWTPTAQTPAWTGEWTNPNTNPMNLVNGDIIQAAPTTNPSSTAFHAQPIGGHY
jgi:hypothetical protein